MKRRVTYAEYLVVVALTLARRHRPRRWERGRCACGATLPCRALHRVPIRREHWPTEEENP